ncbi:molybdopterin-dependent oxidoreductase [Marinomonas sp. THO17]|uniref:molybdopterin-dependent oxidoreductase n=1 Tax=Marinomonas sp. THO17 TaxID=3149048 RepID=UPI00336BDC6B
MKTVIYFLVCVFSSSVFSTTLSLYQQSLPLPDSPQDYVIEIQGKGYQYEDLLEFPLYHAQFSTIWRASGDFIGPKLQDLLEDAGIADFEQVYLEATDDYAVIMPRHAPDQEDAILALALNGKPLKINDKGPFWLVWPSREDTLKLSANEGDLWIWSLTRITKVK